MSINDSILNSVGLTDKNINFLISNDGTFNEVVPKGHDHHLVLRYRASLNTLPERCPSCGCPLLDNVYLNGKDTADYQLPTANGFEQVLSVKKQRYQCRNCLKSLIAQSCDFMPRSKITRPLLYQIIDLAKRDISEKEIAHILHLSTSKINRLMNNAAEAYQTNYERALPSVICVDEIRYAKNQFSFEMIDGQTSDLIELFSKRTGPKIKKNLSNYALANRENVQFVITDMNANYQTPLRTMFPNAQLIIDRFHIIQLALKAVQSTRINLQRSLDNHKSRIYKLLKANWRFFITDENRLNFQQARWFRGINEFMYPQDALRLVFDISPNFKQTYEVYQAVLNSQRHRAFEDFQTILENYQFNHSAMDSVISSYKKNLKGIKNAFLNNYSNGRMEGINRRIKQINRTSYGFHSFKAYALRIRFELFNHHALQNTFNCLLISKRPINPM